MTLLSSYTSPASQIESPGKGDDTRSWNPPAAPRVPDDPRPDLPAESAYFVQVNRNKKRYGGALSSSSVLRLIPDRF